MTNPASSPMPSESTPSPEPAVPAAEKPSHAGPIAVIKIGGSTLGQNDTSLADIVALYHKGVRPVIVHGGGKVITEWMDRQGIRARFVRGLRVTDAASLDIVVAVLTGLVNKQLVNSLNALGAPCVGISGVDGGILRAEIQDPELGFVGRVVKVNTAPIQGILSAGLIPVIAPVAVAAASEPGKAAQLLNVNADVAAGEIAGAMSASRLVMLTDVEGVLDTSKRLIPRLTGRQARELMESGIAGGGMVPKLEACLAAVASVGETHIIDGRRPGALLETFEGHARGTRIG
ncbi:MAG: acetylglutamate kinase [SAR202 cluster bacterium]|nr:acetylglutamate kinase [SAR202 cluster bacterium]